MSLLSPWLRGHQVRAAPGDGLGSAGSYLMMLVQSYAPPMPTSTTARSTWGHGDTRSITGPP